MAMALATTPTAVAIALAITFAATIIIIRTFHSAKPLKIAPSQEVFNTTELLEQILLKVDLKTVLLGQRVSRKFQATIIGSPKLQAALFRTPHTFVTKLEHPIVTPEGYRLRIYYLKTAMKFDFLPGSFLPTFEKLATGSWTRMCSPLLGPSCGSVWYHGDDGEQSFRHLEARESHSNFGEWLEVLLATQERQGREFVEWHKTFEGQELRARIRKRLAAREMYTTCPVLKG